MAVVAAAQAHRHGGAALGADGGRQHAVRVHARGRRPADRQGDALHAQENGARRALRSPVVSGNAAPGLCKVFLLLIWISCRHIHLSQKETFSVEQGVLGVVQNGKEYAITKDDGPVSIEPGVR